MKISLLSRLAAVGMIATLGTACNDNDIPVVNPNTGIGEGNDTFTAAEWYPGGVLGTTSNEQGCYANPSPFVEANGMYASFKKGETFFENDFTINTAPRRGLGPAWVRSGCLYCHPSYGHGQRMDRYRANDQGNGYLLVIYHPTAGVDGNGKKYDANSYITEVTGMPQTKAQSPFLPPIDEDGIHITWKKATDEHGNKFADGTTYDLEYPDITIDQDAFNTDPKPSNYEVRLESTIGIYGTALIDAIDDDSLKAQYAHEAKYVQLNPGMWAGNDWASSAWYTLADGTKHIKRFTYALTRASLQDGPGANAIWNITNVTRSDRHYLYTTAAWAKAMSENSDVIDYIQKYGKPAVSLMHPYYADGSRDSIKIMVNKLLGLSKNDAETRATYEKYFVSQQGEEMSDQDYYDFMVWHRGLAVPQARGLNNDQVKRGKKLFTEMGCATCHRPQWTTGNDNYWAPENIKKIGKLPQYAKQTIWPYSDFVQHRLYMVNDIRGGWCRTTPLWGRGLSVQETGRSDRMHDCRARTVIDAIMWHGYSKQSDAYEISQKFYNLPKADREAVVAFINAI